MGRSPSFVRRRLSPEHRYGLRLTLVAVAVLMVAVPFGFLLEQVTDEGPLTETDTALAKALHEWVRAVPGVIGAFKLLTWLGGPPWFYLLIGFTTLLCLRAGERRIALYLAVTNLAGGALNRLVKELVDRPRPDLDEPIASAAGKSFPSGHAMASAVGYGSLLLVAMPWIPRRARPWAIGSYLALVGAISLSRLVLGVHYMSDVLGGVALGVAWLAASTAAFSIWRRERGRPQVEMLEGIGPEEDGSSGRTRMP